MKYTELEVKIQELLVDSTEPVDLNTIHETLEVCRRTVLSRLEKMQKDNIVKNYKLLTNMTKKFIGLSQRQYNYPFIMER